MTNLAIRYSVRTITCGECDGDGIVRDDEILPWISDAISVPRGYNLCPCCDGAGEMECHPCPGLGPGRECDEPIPVGLQLCSLCMQRSLEK